MQRLVLEDRWLPSRRAIKLQVGCNPLTQATYTPSPSLGEAASWPELDGLFGVAREQRHSESFREDCVKAFSFARSQPIVLGSLFWPTRCRKVPKRRLVMIGPLLIRLREEFVSTGNIHPQSVASDARFKHHSGWNVNLWRAARLPVPARVPPFCRILPRLVPSKQQNGGCCSWRSDL